jgi:hypothetical protein
MRRPAVLDVAQWQRVLRTLALAAATLITVATAGGSAGATTAPTAWERWLHLPGVLDLAGPRSDGRLVAAVRGRLMLVNPSGKVTRFAPGYSVPAGPESYIALSPGVAVDGAGCSFARDDVLALDLTGSPPGITRISATGRVSHLATVTGVTTLSGIALDTVGGFGHRLLVIGPVGQHKTQVSAVDCRGVVTPIGTVDARLEGGIAVAPRGFGAFGGQLVAASEGDGSIYAVSPKGQLSTVAASGVPRGGDIGVESVGFVPPTGASAAYLADRGTPRSGKPHPGTDSLLRLNATALSAARTDPGDLLVATEGAATVVHVHCEGRCVTTVAAIGPAPAHGEGHLLIAGRP